MIYEIILIWFGFSLGFFFTFTAKGKEIQTMLLIKLNEAMPPKK